MVAGELLDAGDVLRTYTQRGCDLFQVHAESLSGPPVARISVGLATSSLVNGLAVGRVSLIVRRR
ncbi:hypothetical protein GCM10018962_80580 [Dactylosporangium matsuzakiense]|uniref:Uncharacterized protein n=1 Tax=Dactylosporangium matsuzakiense TaxID=53360 RepID=A0A9W6NST3_9ACTN|nr:hypothetical protein GCM10017581_095560 [Dactylosporangium matsuzakiense]